MTKLRIIVVTPETPDPFGNAAARWYYALAKGLVRRGHQVIFLSACSPATGRQSLQRARDAFSALGVSLEAYPYPSRGWIARKWNTLMRPYSYFLSDDLRGGVDQALRDGYDILNLEQMWTAYLGDSVERALLSVHHLELLDLAGVVSTSLRFSASKLLMQRTERHLAAKSANIRVTTERLHREVTRLNPGARIFTVPVAIDPELYEFGPCNASGPTVGLIASLSWSPGYNAAVRLLTRVWPKVKKAVPDANLLVVGWDARRALGRYLDGHDVTVIENVPDTKSYFRQLSVLTYPLSQGSGMKIKLLEAMAYGTPVVTTTEGAEGLAAVDGTELFVADEDDVIAERTVQLLSDRQLSRRISRDARGLVEREYSPVPVVARMERIYGIVMSGAG